MKRVLIGFVLSLTTIGCGHRPQTAEAKRDLDHIQYYGCTSCHTIPGVPAAHGTIGPPLDRMGLRTYIAGTLPNTPQHLALWIQHPQQIHPGTAMPDLGVTEMDANDIADYLEGMR
jgi:cytochrome c